MAQEHYFDKLRLDTPAAPKRISSTFSALKVRDIHDIHDGRHDEWLYSSDHANSAPQLPIPGSAVINTDELLLARTLTSEETLSNKLRNGEDLDSNRSETEVSDVAASSTASEGTGSLRTRATSISFAREVTLEDGATQSLEEPLQHAVSAPRAVPILNGGSVQSRLDNEELESRGASITDPEALQEELPLDRRRVRSQSNFQNGQLRTPPSLDISHATASLSSVLTEETQPR
jgi:hypothetical protein